MHVADDMSLLQEYASRNSERAFTTLVSRHINFVYASALRQVKDPHLAEEITQAVFIILARKAGSISRETILSGWLFKTVRFTAAAQLKAAVRRQRREQEAQMNSTIMDTTPDQVWERMTPLLDEALAKLSEKDRQAVLLRYFESKSLAQVGGALAVSEDTARKRVGRAVEKLRQFFVKRGVTLSVAAISGALSMHAVQAAPAGLAAGISAAAVKGSAVSASTLTLVKGALKLMSLAKLKLAAAIGTAAIVAAGATVAAEQLAQSSLKTGEPSDRVNVETPPAPPTLLAANPDPADKKNSEITVVYQSPDAATGVQIDDSAWERSGDSRALAAVPPAVILRPTHFPGQKSGLMTSAHSTEGEKLIARAMPFDKLAAAIYGVPSYQLALPADAPTGQFDALLTVPGGSKALLQEEIRKQFGLVPSREMRESDVLVVKVKTPDAPGLKLSGQKDAGVPGEGDGTRFGGGGGSFVGGRSGTVHSSAFVGRGEYSAQHQSMATLLNNLQSHFDLPLYDETGLTANYDISLKWTVTNGAPARAAVQAAVLEQLGLELSSGRAEIEILVLHKE